MRTLDESYNVFLAVRDKKDAIIKRVPLTSPMEKGYVYANLYFYDEVQKEIDKLIKMIRKILGEITTEINVEGQNPAQLLMELSTRVRNAIGDDSLDALIKEILAENSKHIALLSDTAELDKYNAVKDAIFIEIFDKFFNLTFLSTKDVGEHKIFTLNKQYVSAMTERQKKLFSPALKMVGYINQVKLINLELLPDWTVRYIPERMSDPFEQKEEEMKTAIKRLMEENIG